MHHNSIGKRLRLRGGNNKSFSVFFKILKQVGYTTINFVFKQTFCAEILSILFYCLQRFFLIKTEKFFKRFVKRRT